LNTQISQGCERTDLKQVVNSGFLCNSLLNVTVKKIYQNWSTFAKDMVKNKSGTFYGPSCNDLHVSFA